jgi:nucleoid-associated protein YgaU
MGLFGKSADKDDKKTDFSNVRGGSSTSAARPATSAGGMASTGSRTYTVVAGDSLSKIAQREYGDGSKWQRIWDANRDQIKDPDLIHPGQRLTIPQA